MLFTHFTHVLVISEPETQIIRDRFCDTGMNSLFFVKGQVFLNDSLYFFSLLASLLIRTIAL